MRLVGVLIAMVAPLLLAGCITVSAPASMTPATAPTALPQTAAIHASQERLLQTAKAEVDNIESCKTLLKQNQITSAIGFVRCWGEPTRMAYQQSDLLIMDLVEQRLDVLYRAAAMLDNNQLTGEQFVDVHNKLQDWFIEEVLKRFAGQLPAPSPLPSSSPATTGYK